jgi:hypothetical protein
MDRLRQLAHQVDLLLGLVVSIVLGTIVGSVIGHPLAHPIFSSAIGVAILLLYLSGYSLGTMWVLGLERGLMVVTVFVWCVIVSSFLGSHGSVSSVVSGFSWFSAS